MSSISARLPWGYRICPISTDYRTGAEAAPKNTCLSAPKIANFRGVKSRSCRSDVDEVCGQIPYRASMTGLRRGHILRVNVPLHAIGSQSKRTADF